MKQVLQKILYILGKISLFLHLHLHVGMSVEDRSAKSRENDVSDDPDLKE